MMGWMAPSSNAGTTFPIEAEVALRTDAEGSVDRLAGEIAGHADRWSAVERSAVPLFA